jgi:hypothetical protein
MDAVPHRRPMDWAGRLELRLLRAEAEALVPDRPRR